jgi:hypothetical protein
MFPPCAKVTSIKHRPKLCSPSPAMLTLSWVKKNPLINPVMLVYFLWQSHGAWPCDLRRVNNKIMLVLQMVRYLNSFSVMAWSFKGYNSRLAVSWISKLVFKKDYFRVTTAKVRNNAGQGQGDSSYNVAKWPVGQTLNFESALCILALIWKKKISADFENIYMCTLFHIRIFIRFPGVWI